MKTVLLILLMCGSLTVRAWADDFDELFFRPRDPMAQRDEYGLIHSSKTLYPSDLEPRYHWRPLYYLEGGRDLMHQPAYVGALQTALTRYSYYCGPIDGVWSEDVSTAIAHMQKNYQMRVTGTITIAVRRALCLP